MRAGSEVPLLVEHAVVRQRPLVVHAPDPALRTDRRSVVGTTGGLGTGFVAVDETHDGCALARRSGDPSEGGLDIVDERRLQQQVLGRIARHRELAEHGDGTACVLGPTEPGDDALDVAVQVADDHVELTGRHTDHGRRLYRRRCRAPEPSRRHGVRSQRTRRCPTGHLRFVVVSSHTELEEGTDLRLDFTKLAAIGEAGHHVVPVAVQDADSGEVLIVAYADAEALRATLESGQAVFFSTSRNELWHKGATSGDTLTIVDVRVNCEQNSLVYRVRLDGAGSCHTRSADGTTRHGCYYRVVTSLDDLAFIDD